MHLKWFDGSSHVSWICLSVGNFPGIQIKPWRQDSLSYRLVFSSFVQLDLAPALRLPVLRWKNPHVPDSTLWWPCSLQHFPPQNSPLGIFSDLSCSPPALTILVLLQCCCAPSSPHTFPASVLPAMSSLIPSKWPLKRQLKTHPSLCGPLSAAHLSATASPFTAHTPPRVGHDWCGPLLGVTVNYLCLSLGFTL